MDANMTTTTTCNLSSITTMDEAADYADKLPKLAPVGQAGPAGGLHHAVTPCQAGAPSSADICAGWAAAKPIVMFLMSWPFIPARVKAPIQYVMSLLDGFCSL